MHRKFDGFMGDGSAGEWRAPLKRRFLLGQMAKLAAMHHREIVLIDEEGRLGTDLACEVGERIFEVGAQGGLEGGWE